MMSRRGFLALCALLAVLAAGLVPKAEAQDSSTVGKRDIIFLIDSTMGTGVINTLREYIRQFVATVPFGPDGVQVGVAQFSTGQRVVMDLNTHSTRESLAAALGNIRPRPGQIVKTGAALNFVREKMLKPNKGSRKRVPQIVMLLTSKTSSDSVEEPARALLDMGVLTLAAGTRSANEQELQKIATSDSLVFMSKDFRRLFQNGVEITAALSTLSGSFGIEATEPVQTHSVIRDIVFLVDGSNNTGSSNLPYVRDFMINIVSHLEIRPDRVQIGLIQYAEQPRTEFYLKTYSNRQDVVNTISQLRLTGGSVLNTGAALRYALENMFQPSAGSRKRQGVQQVLVLITAGPSQDEVRLEADTLALGGVLVFTVSSGQAQEEEMRKIAFVESLAYHQRSFSALPALAEVILPKLISVTGDIEETVTTQDERHIAFLIDGTDYVQADFPYIQDFIIKVIEPLDSANDKVCISVVQHSESPSPNFNLNMYQTKDEVMRAVNGMTLAGGRSLNTGAALRYMKDTIMSESNSSCSAQNVSQFLIVLATERSMDDVKEPASELKTEGVVLFGVGIKNADQRQIEAISYNPSFAFNVKESSELNTIPQKINAYVSLPKEQLTEVLKKGAALSTLSGSFGIEAATEPVRAITVAIHTDQAS